MYKHSAFARTSQNKTVGFLHIPLFCLPAVTKAQGSEGGKLLTCVHLLSLKKWSNGFLQKLEPEKTK